MVLFVSALLEAGVREGSRFGVTGNVPQGEDRVDAIKAEIEKHTAGLVDMSNAIVDIKVYPSFGEVGQGEPILNEDPCTATLNEGVCFVDMNGNGVQDDDIGTDGPGGPGDIVLYRISYDWPTMTGMLKPILGGTEGKVPITASIAVRNEPFPEE